MRRKFEFNEDEYALAEEFIVGHQCDSMQDAVISYRFTETGIGLYMQVTCSCGARRDVTDYGSW